MLACSFNICLTPSLSQPVKFPGWKVHGCACKQSIFQSYNTSTFTAVCFDETPFTCQCEKEDKKAEGVQISHFYWSFLSHVMAVKGLTFFGLWFVLLVCLQHDCSEFLGITSLYFVFLSLKNKN